MLQYEERVAPEDVQSPKRYINAEHEAEEGDDNAGVLPSPCFPNFLARTTFVLVSLSEVKIPGQDAIFGNFVFNSSKMQERGRKGER